MSGVTRVRNRRLRSRREEQDGPTEKQQEVAKEVYSEGDQEAGSLESSGQAYGSDQGGRVPEPVGPVEVGSPREEDWGHEADTPSEPSKDAEGAEGEFEGPAEEGSEDES